MIDHVVPAHFGPLFSKRAFRTAGVLGAVGSLLAACGDVFTGYVAAPPPGMNTVMWLSLPEFAEFLMPKPHAHLVIGHYLGVLFIPLNVLGLWHVYLALAPAGALFATLFAAVGTLIAVIGAAFHGMVGLAVTSVRAGDAAALAQAEAYFEPFAWLLTVLGSVVFVALAVAIVTGRSAFPRWMALLSPALTQIWITLVAMAAPLEVAVMLLVTGFNLSVFVFFLGSTLRLWHYDPSRP